MLHWSVKIALTARRLVACGFALVMGTATLAEDGIGVVAGTKEADRSSAAALFHDVCVATAPGFEKAESVLRSQGFNRKTDTGTFYHPVYNLSVQISTGDANPQCSFVNIAKGDPAEMAMDYAAVTFYAVPEADRGKTEISGFGTGQLHVRHPGIGELYVDVKNIDDLMVTHVVLAPQN